jgi:hypothetical protein
MKANVVVFDSRIELDWNGDQAERKDTAGDGPSHPARVSCHWRADLRASGYHTCVKPKRAINDRIVELMFVAGLGGTALEVK